MHTLKCFTAFSLWRILDFLFYWITIIFLQDRFLLIDEVSNQHECLCFYFTSHACFVLYISLCVFCGTCRSTSLRTSLSLCCSDAPRTSKSITFYTQSKRHARLLFSAQCQRVVNGRQSDGIWRHRAANDRQRRVQQPVDDHVHSGECSVRCAAFLC